MFLTFMFGDYVKPGRVVVSLEVWQGAMPSSGGHRAESQPQPAAHHRQWISFSHML
jgi:hypothetical protein